MICQHRRRRAYRFLHHGCCTIVCPGELRLMLINAALQVAMSHATPANSKPHQSKESWRRHPSMHAGVLLILA